MTDGPTDTRRVGTLGRILWGAGIVLLLLLGLVAFQVPQMLFDIDSPQATEPVRPDPTATRVSIDDPVHSPPQEQPSAPAGIDQAMAIRRACVGCHTLGPVRDYHKKQRTREDWLRVSRRMKAYGMKISDSDLARIADHLAAGKDY